MWFWNRPTYWTRNNLEHKMGSMQETFYWSFFLRIRNSKLNWMTEIFSILVYCATRVCLTFALWRVCIVRVWLWNTVSMCILASSTAAKNFPFTFPKQNQTFTLNFTQNKIKVFLVSMWNNEKGVHSKKEYLWFRKWVPNSLWLRF